ncbi:MAG: cation:proton antiporter [Actinomycetota bacterium]|nr:cation:proton antiporter [Actinomycetota bacterium]
MGDTQTFAFIVLLAASVGVLALLSNRVTERLRVPAPLLVLVASAVAVTTIPALHAPPERTVERVVTVALVMVLFDGGLHIGWSRFRAALAPIALVGVLGTFLTVLGTAAFIHFAVGINWYLATLVATAVAPTDPAVVFSVLGKREISGRSGTILEGESGANDPVGIALMASLLTAGGLDGGTALHVGGEFALQMGVGLVIGLIGARALLWFMRVVPLPGEALYPLRTIACAFIIFGVATIAHGSGFLAVFVAGIAIGEERAPYKREVEKFAAAMASLGEIIAFVVLGLTIDLSSLIQPDVWVPGLAVWLVMSAVVRPLFVGVTLWPAKLRPKELSFVLFAGLKGAVPILLGDMLLHSGVPDAQRLYGIIVVVVILSVAFQGTLVPSVARRLRLPMHTIEPEPFAFGVRLGSEPDSAVRLMVAAGSVADGTRIEDLDELPEDAWISLVVRGGDLVNIRRDTVLKAGDDVLILAEAEHRPEIERTFTESGG